MRCLSCGFENKPDASFCIRCGAKMARVCANCGATLPVGSIFCPACGFKNAEPAENYAPVTTKHPALHRKAPWIITASVVLVAAVAVFLLLFMPGLSTPASSGLLSAKPQYFIIETEGNGKTCTLYLQYFKGGSKQKIADDVQSSQYYDMTLFQSIVYVNEDDELCLYKNGQTKTLDKDVGVIAPGNDTSRLTVFYEKDDEAYMYRDGMEPVELPYSMSAIGSVGTAFYSFALRYESAPLFLFQDLRNTIRLEPNSKGFLMYGKDSFRFYNYQTGEDNKIFSGADSIVGYSTDMNSIAYLKNDKLYIIWDVSLPNAEPEKFSIEKPLTIAFKNGNEAFVREPGGIVNYIRRNSDQIVAIDMSDNVPTAAAVSGDGSMLYFAVMKNQKIFDLYALNISSQISKDMKAEKIASKIIMAMQYSGDSAIYTVSADDGTIQRIDGGNTTTIDDLEYPYIYINKSVIYDFSNGELTVFNLQDGTNKTVASDVASYKVISRAGNGMILYLTDDGDLYLLEGTTKTKLDFDAEDANSIHCNLSTINIKKSEAATVQISPAPTATPKPTPTKTPTPTAEPKPYRIGFIGPMSEPVVQRMIEGLTAFAEDNPQYELIISGYQEYNDTEAQIQNTENLIAQGVDGIIFYCDFTVDSGVHLMLIAQTAGVATVVIGGAPDLQGATYVLRGMNNEAFAHQLAHRFAEKVGYKGKVAIGAGYAGSTTLTTVQEVLSANYPDIQIVETFISEYDQAKALDTASQCIEKYSGLKGFLTLDPITSKGVSEAVRVANLQDKVVIFGMHTLAMITEDDVVGSLSSFLVEDLKQTGYASGILMSMIFEGMPARSVAGFEIPGFETIIVEDHYVSGYNWFEINADNISVYVSP